MSFILDALKKSERERRQDAKPSIARIPDAVPSRRTPAWAIGTIAALGFGVVALGGAWVHAVMTAAPQAGPSAADSGNGGRTAETSAQTRIEAVSLPASPPSGSTLAAAANERGSSAEQGIGEPVGGDANSADAPSAGAAFDSPSMSRVASPDRVAAASGETHGTVSSRLDARTARSSLREAASAASGAPRTARPAESQQPALPALEPSPASYSSTAPSLGLPELNLELLAYSDRAAERFVFINGTRYVEGDTLPGGARVIAINSRGAVLLAAGRQLQLDQH